MPSRWFADLDAHIATGLVAAEAESAEMLSWLLKLEPEQRWCLVLGRDQRLARLVASDYRRLLKLMVELEASALAAAPSPPLPCIAETTAPLALLPYLGPPPPRAWWRAGRWGWMLIALAFLAIAGGGAWLLAPDGQHQRIRLEQWTANGMDGLRQIWTRSDTAQASKPLEPPPATAPTDTTLAAAIQSDPTPTNDSELAAGNDRSPPHETLVPLLEALLARLEAGESFADDLAALQLAWPDPEALAFLSPPDGRDPDEPFAPRGELNRLNTELGQRIQSLFQLAQTGRVRPSDYYAHAQSLETLRRQSEMAMNHARQEDWTAAMESLKDVQDPGYRDWREQLTQWLATRERLAELLHRTRPPSILDPGALPHIASP